MSNVVVVAAFKAKAGKEAQLEQGLRDLAAATHDEAGCLSYALHRDRNDPRTFTLVEKWTSQVALEAHLQQPYVQAVAPLAAELLDAPPIVHFCDPLPAGDPVKGAL